MDLSELPFLDASFPLPLDQPFTAAMARREGVPRHRLTELGKQQLLRQPVRGVYLAAQAGDSNLLRAQSLALVVPADAVVCDEHAGWLHGAEMVLALNEHLALQPISMFRPSDHGRLRNKLSTSGERNLRATDVVEVLGVAVASPIRTAWDLGRRRFRERSLAGLDQMLRLRRFSHEELVAGVERFRGERWVRHLRELAPLADGRAESPGESVLRLRWRDCGLPVPKLQVEVRRSGLLIARLDLGNEQLRYAAEYDGAEWHNSPAQLAYDRRRRNDVAYEDWIIDALTKVNVFGHARDCELIPHAGVRRARQRYGTIISRTADSVRR